MGNRLAETPVAIVGMSALMPGARNVREFWQNIVDGRDCLEDVPDRSWPVDTYYDPDPSARDKTYCRRGGFVPAVAFDALAMGVPPAVLPSTDIVQLLSLVVARDLLRDARVDGASWYDPARTGVVLGVSGALSLIIPLVSRLQAPVVAAAGRDVGLSQRDADEIADRFSHSYVGWDEASFPGFLSNVVAGRVANRFNLGGLNCTVDAACASSLAAVNVAVRELVDGRADMMITGGCAIDNTVFTYLAFSKTPALSASGHVRPFDDAADGTLLGDGIGMVALRRLADARRDNNRIYAVIRGIGAANDGRSGSIYAPQEHGQVRALTRAYADAEVSPASVGLFEGHGTGTRTGDGVELAALSQVIGAATDEREFAALGSVKSQIGHTKAAAGAASLIKVAMALHEKVLPPTINVTRPAAATEQASGLYVNTIARPWITDPRRSPRRAAVSSFGFGGTNYHLVLEEFADRPAMYADTSKVAVWHAEDVATLAAAVSGAEPMDADAVIPPKDARIGVVYRDSDELAVLRETARQLLVDQPEAPRWSHPAGIVGQRGAPANPGKVAALFAGQGAQYVNMGRTALLCVPPVRQAFDALEQVSANGLSRIAFPPPGFTEGGRERQEELLRGTEFAQPAIGALSMGQYTWLRDLGFTPDGVLGHSFGELTALWAAGALDDAGFLSLAVARGRAMAAPAGADPGSMAALKAPRQVVDELLSSHQDLVICHANAPDQFVVGGATPLIDELLVEAAARGMTASRLPVSAAFHTGFVAHAAEAFRAAVAAITLHSPKLPVYANTAGASYGTEEGANKAVLVNQMLHPVDFAGRITQMYEAGYRVFVEFGPKSILTQLVRRTIADADVVCVATDAGPRSSSDRALKLAALRLRVLGLPIKGIGRYDHPAESPPEVTGAEIPLAGVNYRPVTTDASTPPHDREDGGQVMGMDLPVEAGDLLHRQLELAADYLDGQLRLNQEFIAKLADNVDGMSTQQLKASLELAGRYSSLIAQTQSQSRRALAELWGGDALPPMSSGGPPPIPERPPVIPERPPAIPERPPAIPERPPVIPERPPVVPDRPPVNSVVVPKDSVEHNGNSVAVPVHPDAAAGEVEARAALLDVVADKTGYPVDTLRSSMDIEADLGIDSIKRVEIMGGLKGRFPSAGEVSAERMAALRTLDDVVRLLVESGPADISRTQVVPQAIDQVVVPGKAFAAPAASLVIDDGSALTAPVVAELHALGLRPRLVTLPGWDEATLAAAIAEVVGATGRLDLCVVLAAAAPATVSGAVGRLTHAILAAKLTQPHLLASADDGRSGFVVITQLDGRMGLRSPGLPGGLVGGLGGLVKTLALEAPALFCRAIDVAPGLPEHTVRALIGSELNDQKPAPHEVGHDGRKRWTPTVASAPPGTRSVRAPDPTDLFVVTGGARGVTAGCVRALAARYHCELVILGRTVITGEPGWAAGATGPQLKSAIVEQLVAAGEQVLLPEVERRYRRLLAQREARANLAALRAGGARFTYLPVDILDRDAVTAALAGYRHRVTGVIHGAGVLADRLVVAKSAEEIEGVLATKVTGLENILAGLDLDRLDHVVVFSSVAGLFGNRGQADYAVANEALNRMAVALKASRPGARVTSINWGAWDGGMVTPVLRELFEHNGIALIPAPVGNDMFVEQFAAHRGDDTVVLIAPAGQRLAAARG